MREAGIDDEITNGKRGMMEIDKTGGQIQKEFFDKERWVAWFDRKQRLLLLLPYADAALAPVCLSGQRRK